jgi:hypothetical protein
MKQRAAFLGILTLLAGGGVQADEFLPRAALSVIYSDNISRQANNIGSDTVVTASAGFHYLHDSQRWHTDLAALGSYTDFLENTFDSRTLGSGSLLAGVTLLPRYLTWEVQDNYGQIATDSFSAIETADRQNVNYLTTGPNLQFPLGRSRIDLQARYSDVAYDGTSTLDNTRTSAELSLVRPWTDIRTLSVNLFRQHTEFDRDDLFRNYYLNSAFLSLRSTPRRSVYQFELGATEVDDGLRKSRGTLLGLTYGHELTQASSIQFYGRRGFADSADTFRFEQGGSSDPIIIDHNVQVRADPYRETRIDAAFVSSRARGAFSVMPYMVDENYINNDAFDRKRIGLRADVSYAFGATWRLDGFISGEHFTYADSAFDHRDVQMAVGVARYLSVSTQLTGRFERFDRSGTVDDYTENRVMLLIAYAPTRRTRIDPTDPTRILDRARGTNSQPTFQTPAPVAGR